ncbi:hydrolase [Rhodococcus phage ChewyVIII]|uniref:Hydrolase n=1 Tax=Rhodococcus phage ChewyVIII TaxID=1887657 RepID=A0A1C9EI76_9CAUD|nr:hydrolase [Rhodococcus phage ChewyVIII]AON97472.1 hydrolase [Rhodococcus phage ChewyVIII]
MATQYARPEIVTGVTKLDKPFFENTFDGIDMSKFMINSVAANASRWLCKMNRGIDNTSILICGDSTGNEPIEHFYLMAQAIAAQFPKHTVLYRLWNDTARNYDAAVTIQTGQGATPPTLTVWNCSVSGFATFHFVGERFTQAFETLTEQPDLIMISHGHNMLDVTTGSQRAGFRPNVLCLTEELTQAFPDSGLILMSQNPTFTAGRENWQNIKATEMQAIAARRGYGFIDIHQVFQDTGNPRDYVKADLIHPTTSADAPAPNGSMLWAAATMKALQYQGAVPSPSQRASYFMDQARSLIPNTGFETWTAPEVPDGWTLTNCLAEKDTVNFETGTFGLKLTAVATGASMIQFSASPASLGIKGLVSGKYVTVGVRVFVPATNTISGVGIMLRDQGGSTTQRRVDISSATRGRFHWLYATKKIDAPGTNLTIQISPQWTGAFAATNTMTVDRIRAVEGDVPRFA